MLHTSTMLALFPVGHFLLLIYSKKAKAYPNESIKVLLAYLCFHYSKVFTMPLACAKLSG